ncbi:L-histidine N(alpha)-methyltransferase [Sphingomonas jeddahensis]|uniref:Histidine-specific methyltransferase EgtD n=1 Tax=Sphingomonas jeddahensis TaxID=1915074 RepID=A0A1V2EU13_9SPHN|nr:L-histidine N(alpha)-methyltransferase [Sphingomonas jeddahensis]ONF95669.1 Histidine-specific methyltransferase EgtD [Sphingomonas jeddahensis]
MLKQEVKGGQASLADPRFRADVLNGLDRRPRAIPARWFYDRCGSELFEQITGLPEYYPTRAETGILAQIAPELAALVAAGSALVEFGSGSSTKTPLVLDAIKPSAYVPIDISGDFLRDSSRALSARYPDLFVLPFEADFTRALSLPRTIAAAPKLGFFPGSTIGNLIPHAAVDLLRAMRASLGLGAHLLIGMDRIKDVAVLERAYDDAAGVTAAFNSNLLARINRELDGTIPIEAFRHRAIWNDERARIEMHLEATRDVSFTVEGQPFTLVAGETIHTENSHKYGPRDARILLRAGGWTPIAEWTDPKGLFAVYLAQAQAERPAP